MADARPPCFLTVDLEDWTDARLSGRAPASAVGGAADEAFDPSGTERLLDLFAARGARATFFVLGTVAARAPGLVRRVARDHEVATHGATHADLRALDPKRLADGLRDARRRIEDLTGRAVLGYRAPNWSLGAVLSWAPPVLEAAGLVYDSSLIPGRGLLFLPGARVPREPHVLAGTRLWEFPPTSIDLGFASFPAAGGAFLRLLPESIARGAMRRARGRGETPHLYVHPWEVGPAPRCGAARRALLTAGGAGLVSRLGRILEEFRGTAIGDRCGALARVAA
ncbi:MAG TPA: polysaccharide deacetylase family protein [Patescibacteria group bacterium]|nr:polysaccharide deacetylase family protein [Patescibacteria group bacterium]